MIVPMKKVSLVLMDKYREESLIKLREAGVLHIEQKKVSSDSLSRLLEKKAKIENALSILRAFEARAKAEKMAIQQKNLAPHKRSTDFVNAEGAPFSAEALDAPNGKREDLFLHVLRLDEEQKSLLERINVLLREQNRIKGWGDFKPKDVRFLKENGVVFYLYEFNPKAFGSLPADVSYFIVKQTKTVVYAAVLGSEIPANRELGETQIELGKYSLSDIDILLADIRNHLADIDKQFLSLFFRRQVLEKDLGILTEQIEFETANAGMVLLEDAPAESTVSWISGFAPYDSMGTLKRAAA